MTPDSRSMGLDERLDDGVQEGDERFRLLANAAPVMIWMAGRDALCTFFNKPWLEFTGRTMEQELGDGWAEGVHPADFDRCIAAYRNAFGRREEFSMDYRLRRADGAYRWVLDRGVPLYGSASDFMGYIGSCVDITDRKEAEEALRLSEAHYRSLFELSAAGTGEVELTTGRYVRVNDAFCTMTGYTRDELLCMTFTDITHPDDREEDSTRFTRLSRGELPTYQLEKRYVRKDGSIIWVQVTTALIRDDADRPISELGLVLDISERKRAERELQELASRLLASQDDERRRIARELHDQTAQSLLALSLNLDEVLTHYRILDERARDLLTQSLQMGRQLSDDIRTLSYLLHPPFLEDMGLQTALDWYIDGFVKRSGIDVVLTIPGDLGRLNPDLEIALFRVVQESLTNIHRHSRNTRASIVLDRESEAIVLEVVDEGAGVIAEDGLQRERTFRPGVGIAGMRQRVAQLGGQLHITSQPTSTVVRVSVPWERARP